ncbi:unnamed protein product [Lactuca virosa]|uniref:Dirigent protein n=1 Tax=Lactuca virosa TaxID=75947 RepID=A0AAU9L9C6_9ASTR|nr:unnamed protein product [Lactuca virosa]
MKGEGRDIDGEGGGGGRADNQRWPVVADGGGMQDVVGSAIGVTIFSAMLASWALTFTIGGERLFGHTWDELDATSEITISITGKTPSNNFGVGSMIISSPVRPVIDSSDHTELEKTSSANLITDSPENDNANDYT